MPFDNLMVMTGNANPKLAQKVARHLNVQLGKASVSTFSDGEIMVELLENVRGRTCSCCSRPARRPTTR